MLNKIGNYLFLCYNEYGDDMKAVKGIISAILTLIVIPIMMAFIVYLSANAILSKDNIEKVIKRVNVSDFLVDEDGEYTEAGKEIKDDLVKNGLPEEVFDEFINSKEITDFVSEYAGNVTEYVLRGKELEELNAEDISSLINNNVDTIVTKLKDKKVEGYEELTDEKVAEFKSHVNEISKEIADSIPSIKEEMEKSDVTDAIRIVRFIFSGVVYAILVGIILFLLIIIILLNLNKNSYLIWLGVIFMLSSAPLVLITKVMSYASIESNSKAVFSIIDLVTSKLSFYSYGFFIVGIISIAIAIISRTIQKAETVE